ncbi:MAG: AAA family ATPase, partial [Actinomycetota bacterium]|nr:AAA family ATPase [Actinomycetota bacterium]
MILTQEQERIVAAAAGGDHMKVKAYAGTGKTSTSVAMSERALGAKRVLYLAFNKSIATEAQRKMPANVEAKTAHSLAYRATVATGRFSRDRLQPGTM